MRTLFLFGSWISPAPKVGELTDGVLNEPMYRATNGDFLPGVNPSPLLASRELDISRVVPTLLRQIRADFAYYQRRKPIDITYEDLAFMCSQFYHEWESGMMASPATGAYYEDLEKTFLSDLPSGMRPQDAFSALIRESVDWIKAAVVRQLNACTESPGACVEFFHRFPFTSGSSSIATLNHDCFLERHLKQTVNLGFLDESPLAHFDAAHLHSENGIRVIKLHGSTDWFWAPNAQVYVRRVAYNKSGEDLSLPIILIGTANKVEDYTRHIFPHLFHAFQNELYRCSRMVVSGYGFKDGGVNRRLIDWFHSGRSTKMLVIHPDPQSLREDAFVPYSMRRILEGSSLIEKDEAPREFHDGVTFVRAKFDEAAKPPFDAIIERFLAD